MAVLPCGSLFGSHGLWFALRSASLRNLYVPRELTQYIRRKYCRQELHLPLRFNYFWDLAAAALDSRSRDVRGVGSARPDL